MFISVITVVLFLAGVLGLLLFPKTKGRLNGVKMIVMGTMAVFCYLALLAAIYNKVGIFVGLPSACVSLGILNAALWGGIIRHKKVQRLFWRWGDVIGLVLTGAFVVGIAIHIFTAELALRYWNVDAASHFLYANRIVERGSFTSQIYFSAFVDAFFIQLLAPMLAPILYFKAFIVADIFMHMLEMWMFYCLVLTIGKQKITRILAPVLAIGYFFGYPAYSFLTGHFVYWSTGVMIFILMIYALVLIEKHKGLLKYSIPLLLLAAYANTCCNKLFVPVNTFALFAVVFMIFVSKQRDRKSKRRLVGGAALIAVAAILAAAVYLLVWGENLSEAFEKLLVPGGIYSAMYADMIFFLPALFFVVYQVFWKKEQHHTVAVVSVSMAAVTVGMYVMWYMHLMSVYYYYKIYYNLWLCGWLLIAAALEIMAQRKHLPAFFSYFGMAALICFITLSDYDVKTAKVHKDYNGYYATTQMFPIYRFNMDSLRMDYKKFLVSDKTLEVYRYVLEDMKDDDVRLISSSIDTRRWHDAIDQTHKKARDISSYSNFMELLKYLEKKDVYAVIVQKGEPEYQIYKDYFDRCGRVYENEDAAVLTPAGDSWLAVPEELVSLLNAPIVEEE